jgi:hypothetical protein
VTAVEAVGALAGAAGVGIEIGAGRGRRPRLLCVAPLLVGIGDRLGVFRILRQILIDGRLAAFLPFDVPVHAEQGLEQRAFQRAILRLLEEAFHGGPLTATECLAISLDAALDKLHLVGTQAFGAFHGQPFLHGENCRAAKAAAQQTH